jgi:hypothetical protein
MIDCCCAEKDRQVTDRISRQCDYDFDKRPYFFFFFSFFFPRQ